MGKSTFMAIFNCKLLVITRGYLLFSIRSGKMMNQLVVMTHVWLMSSYFIHFGGWKNFWPKKVFGSFCGSATRSLCWMVFMLCWSANGAGWMEPIATGRSTTRKVLNGSAGMKQPASVSSDDGKLGIVYIIKNRKQGTYLIWQRLGFYRG